MTTIRQTHFYGGGAVWRAENLNGGATTPLEDLAGKNGKRDREASLEVLSGPDGNRYVRIPQGTTGQRPSNPAGGLPAVQHDAGRHGVLYRHGMAAAEPYRGRGKLCSNLNANGDVGTNPGPE